MSGSSSYLSNSVDFSLTGHVRAANMRGDGKQRAFNFCSSSDQKYILTYLSFVDCQWKRGSKSGVLLQAKRYLQQPYNACR